MIQGKTKKSKEVKEQRQQYTEDKKNEIIKEFDRIVKQNAIEQDKLPKIQNMVSTIKLQITSSNKDSENQEKLNLDKIASKCQNCEYKKSRFPALIQRIKDPKSTALIFEAGKMVITGTKSFDHSKDAAQKFVTQIQKATKLQIKIDTIQTSNIVANSQLPYEVNLQRVWDDQELKAHITYDRNQFPGLIYKMIEPKLAALIFYSGKIVFTGAKNDLEIKDAYSQLCTILKKHERQEKPKQQ